MTTVNQAKFQVGELVQHKLFEYRGVVADVDPSFQLSEDWYRQMAKTRPPKDKPWYRVLVDGAGHETYVAERNLKPDDSDKPVKHPAVDDFFAEFEGGRYRPRGRWM